MLRRLLKLIFRALRFLVFAVMILWTISAVYYSNLPAGWLRTFSAIVCLILFGVILWRVRPWWLTRLACFGLFAVVGIWFLLIPPSNHRDWQPDLAVLPYAEVNGDRVIVHNIRNCDYRTETDFTIQHYDKTLDLTKLRSVDLYLVYWGSSLIAHTMLSFGFEGGDYLCFSIETRKEKGEAYSAVKGFFRQYELTYVVGDERDLVRLRTNFRGEQVYLYRLQVDMSIARAVFLDYIKEVNRLYDRPEWYNALTSNCTTNIRGHTYPYAKKSRWNWRLLANGYVDELAYQVGSLNQSLPFKVLKQRSLINDRAKAADNDSAFSARIRDGLPGVTSLVAPTQQLVELTALSGPML